MLRKRRSDRDYGWLVGDRLIGLLDDPATVPDGWTASYPGAHTAWKVATPADTTETSTPGVRVIGYAFSAVDGGVLHAATPSKGTST